MGNETGRHDIRCCGSLSLINDVVFYSYAINIISKQAVKYKAYRSIGDVNRISLSDGS